MEAYASIKFELPAGLKFDGVQEIGPARFLQFTEYDEASPSLGATFYVAADQVIESEIAARRLEVRQKFSAASHAAQGEPGRPLTEIAKRSGHETAAAESHPIANTEPRRDDTSPLEVESARASEGPERAGHKPLMRNPSAHSATPTGHTNGDAFLEWHGVNAEVGCS